MGCIASKQVSMTHAQTPDVSEATIYNKENSVYSNNNDNILLKKLDTEVKHENIHPVNPDIKIHSVVSSEMDPNHKVAMSIKLGEVTDEQLLGNTKCSIIRYTCMSNAMDRNPYLVLTSSYYVLAEVARRRIDLHDKITDTLVKETYEVGRVLGHGASGGMHAIALRCLLMRNSTDDDGHGYVMMIMILLLVHHCHCCGGNNCNRTSINFS